MIRLFTRRPVLSSALLLSASSLAMVSVPAHANDVLFSSTGRTGIATGQRVAQGPGILQIRLDNGATASFTQGAEFLIGEDSALELYRGSVTVAGAANGVTVVRMPEGVEGRVGGTGNAASFSVGADDTVDGHTLSGVATIARAGISRDFAAGQMWASRSGGALRRVIARGAQATPQAGDKFAVAEMAKGGPLAAATNGLPVSLGDALAAAGASSDIVAAAQRVEAANGNPRLGTFPTGDLALLVSRAADLQGLYGGQPFPAAQADIIRAYLGFLADGGSGADFVTAYSGFLTQYLALIRTGGLPSNFDATALGDIDAFLF